MPTTRCGWAQANVTDEVAPAIRTITALGDAITVSVLATVLALVELARRARTAVLLLVLASAASSPSSTRSRC